MLIIPAIDIQEGRCVRLTQGKRGTTTVYSEDPVGVAREWVRQGARRLHVIDLDGAFDGKPINQEVISGIAKAVSIPVQVGGGIRTIDSASNYINSGIEYVILGSKLAQDDKFIEQLASAHPAKIIVGIDARGGRVMTEGWTRDSGLSAIDLARRAATLGAAAIIYTDIERDGMLGGPNLQAISNMAAAVEIPVIASGGISRLEDIQSLLSLGPRKVAGAVIGKALYTGGLKLPEALAEAGD